MTIFTRYVSAVGQTGEKKLRFQSKTYTCGRGLRLAKQQLCTCMHHAFLYISLPSLHDYNVKLPNFTF